MENIYSGVHKNIIGNLVKIKGEPVAVIGDENCIMPLTNCWEGAISSLIRKPEDLPD